MMEWKLECIRQWQMTWTKPSFGLLNKSFTMVNDQSNYNWKDPGAGRAASDHTIKNVSVIQFIWGQVTFLDSN